MKKSYLFGMFALAAMTMVGCSNDEVVENFSQDNAIEFGTYVGRDAQSRGQILTNDGLKEQGFGVYAYYTGQSTWAEYSNNSGIKPNFMNNTKVTYDEKKQAWTYSPLKYWPNNVDDKVSFFAYAPYDEEYELTTSSITYTMPDKIEDHIDLTWTNSNQVDVKKQNIDEKVMFVFQHALSKIDFTIAAATDEINPENNRLDKHTTITVNSVHLGGKDSKVEDIVNSEGNTEAKATIEGIFTKTATLNLNNSNTVAAWVADNSTGLISYSLYPENFETQQLTYKNTPEAQLLTKNGSQLMIIPQEFEDGFYVLIDYTVATVGENEAGESDNSTITNRILKKVEGLEFESGKQYKLNLILGMTSVKVEASVTNWVTADATEVDLPENNPNN